MRGNESCASPSSPSSCAVPPEERTGKILREGNARVTLIPFQMAAPFDATLSRQVL